MKSARGSRVVSRARARQQAAAWRAAGETVVLAEGVFDLLQVGHARDLAGAAKFGTRLIVAVSGDAPAHALLGPGRPVMAAADRSRLVAALRPVDLAVINEEATVDRLVDELRPAVRAPVGDARPGTGLEGAIAPVRGTSAAMAGDPGTNAGRGLFERVRERAAAGTPRHAAAARPVKRRRAPGRPRDAGT